MKGEFVIREGRGKKMGKGEMERLNQTLTSHLTTIHETLQILDQTPSSSLQKLCWDDVIKLAEQLSKNATTAGMLFTGEKIEVKALEENMESYFNVLQGLLLTAYGSTVGAGPTLSSYIHSSIKQVVDCSFLLWRECVASYDFQGSEQKCSVPQLTGTVWEACSAVKKTPATNIVAVGRAMTKIAVSMKDVLREMKELELCSSEPTDEPESNALEGTTDFDLEDDDEFGKDLSPEEKKIAQLAIGIVSEAITFIKELIRAISGLLKKENLKDEHEGIESLEKLLKSCRSIGVQVDELGACLYPPQEFSTIEKSCKEMSSLVDEINKDLDCLSGSTEAFSQGYKALKNALEVLKVEVSGSLAIDAAQENSSAPDMVEHMQNLAV
ncbi:Cyclin-D1-binding protein 1-like protein [Bienertia sinuspersici]